MFDAVIRGGEVVTPGGVVRADIGIEGEYIASVAPELPGGKAEYNASGLTVLPALLDVHVHFNDPGRDDWEGAASGSRALAAGGGSMFIDMPLNSSPCTVNARGFDEKLAALESGSVLDFAIWGGIIPGNTGELAELAERGVAGFKAFMCDSGLPEFPRSDEDTLYRGMRQAAALGLPVLLHAESEGEFQPHARRDASAFLASRPVSAETEAIRLAGTIARETGCRLHIVHVSSGSGVAEALAARGAGADISIETCPHYLAFTDSDVMTLGAVAKCCPPFRPAQENEALWAAVLRGEVDMIGSDHSPCLPEMKRRDDFFAVWGGIAGVQSTLPVLIGEGMYRRGLPLPALADLLSGAGARRFGFPEKGAVAPWRHADLALVDLNAVTELTTADLLQRHPVSPYVGRRMRGSVRATFRRGERVWSDGIITAERNGRYLRPERTSHAASGPHP